MKKEINDPHICAFVSLSKSTTGIRATGWGRDKSRAGCGITLGERKAENILSDVSPCVQNTLHPLLAADSR